MSYRDTQLPWPFLNPQKVELGFTISDQRYINAMLVFIRQIFKIRSRRTLTTGNSYIEILRLLQLPKDEDDLSLSLAKLNGGGVEVEEEDMDMDTTDEEADQVCNPGV